MIWIIIALIWAFLCTVCWLCDNRKDAQRHAARILHREQQNREWREQFNELPETVRAAIRMVREDRRETLLMMALLELHGFKKRKLKEEVDWKKEGF